MGYPLFTLKEYFKYRSRAKNAHGLHSPFLFKLFNEVINGSHTPDEIELLSFRKGLKKDTTVLHFTDPKTQSLKKATISKLATHVAASHKFSVFLRKLCDYLAAERVLETGTSIGLTTTYLAYTSQRQVLTLEGSSEIAGFAQKIFCNNKLSNVQIIKGNIHETFSMGVEKFNPDIIFLDAEHTGKTLKYYLDVITKNKTPPKCIVVHDIHWSEDMQDYWEEIVKDEKYTLTVDIFEAGLIFPKYPAEKQHFSLKF